MRLKELLFGEGLECPSAYENVDIPRIVTNSGDVTPSCMFICHEGNDKKRRQYINEAIGKGAVVILASQVRDECVGGAAIIKTDNTRRVAARLYSKQCCIPGDKLKIIGVTGTNGKTSVCCALECIAMAAGKKCAVIGTVGCRIDGRETENYGGLTTPDSAELYPLLARMCEAGVEYVFMEVSSHALAQHRVDGITFECAAFTNLSRDHLDYHADMEDYFLCKARLFSISRKKIINIDGAYGKRLLSMYPDSVTCSVGGDGDFFAQNVRCDTEGTEYQLIYEGGRQHIRIGALGDFSAENSLTAAAVAMELGMTVDAVVEGLSHFCGARGRMERVDVSAPFCVIIDYAHTPDGLERALRSTRDLRDATNATGKVILVFGCGGDRDRGKRKDMGIIATRLADEVIVTSDNPRGEHPEEIISQIMRGTDKEKPCVAITSRRRAIEYAVEIADEGDVILLAGKGHEKYQILADGKHPFDETEIVKQAVSVRYGTR